jgi:uncharacterized protein
MTDARAASTAAGRPLALVTGASTGIGLELARCFAEDGFDLILAADTPLDEARRLAQALGARVETVQGDLATPEGVDALCEAVGRRTLNALAANAGHGLGHAFLDQRWADIRHVVDTNITGTVALLHRLVPGMRDRGQGRILLTGSIAGLIPGSFQAVYNASKAFVDSFAFALRNELKDTGVTVTCLMPGPTDTQSSPAPTCSTHRSARAITRPTLPRWPGPDTGPCRMAPAMWWPG